jgi:hypothetical protein
MKSDWRGLNPLQVKILLNPLQSPQSTWFRDEKKEALLGFAKTLKNPSTRGDRLGLPPYGPTFGHFASYTFKTPIEVELSYFNRICS